MKKPSVNTKCVANNYAAENERIIEFNDDETCLGGLISIRRMENGTIDVSVYRADHGVTVNGLEISKLRESKSAETID